MVTYSVTQLPCTCYFTLSTSLSQLAICLSNCLSDCLHSHHVIASDLFVATLSGWTNYNSNGKVILIWWIGGYTILHPPSQPAPANALPQGMAEPVDIHPVVFETLDAAKIRSAALRTSGAAGPSGLDAKEWRRLCTSFKHASKDLCHSLALMARRLSTTYVDPRGLSPFLACRLIALNKHPGVCPIGVCETSRIIAKAILSITRGDIQDAAGSLQLCAGQIAGTEAAVHAARETFSNESTEAILFVDASNAFNSLNRQAALHNIRHLCPSIATILINTYRDRTDLFVEGSSLLSQEGTTQGDPLAMPMYALATIPLIHSLPDNVQQAWYADDASAAGQLKDLQIWWDALVSSGSDYGYHANATKTWLVTKPQHLQAATSAFSGTKVNITAEGRPYLGTAIGTKEYCDQFVEERVTKWCNELERLVHIAETEPHAAYAAFTHDLTSKWNYLSCTTPNISDHLAPLETIIRTKFIPTLTGRSPPNDAERDLLALPVRLGGIGVIDPSKHSSEEFSASLKITTPLKTLIRGKDPMYPFETWEEQYKAKDEVHKSRRKKQSDTANQMKPSLPSTLQRSMMLAQEKGASSWMTTLPVAEFGFTLHKGAFRDALCLRYGWQPSRIPINCECGNQFSVEHALSCPKGGFPSIRHNEIRDLTASLLSEVCNDVCTEPHLQPISGEHLSATSANTQEGTRLDIAANGLWGGRLERTYFDVRVFNPHAPSNRHTTPSACYRKHENLKKRAYQQRIREIEHSSFSPLALSSTGGLGPAATSTYKRLGNQSYSSTMSWLRCRLSFSLLRSSIQAIRGARSAAGRATKSPIPPIDLVTSESQVTQLSEA